MLSRMTFPSPNFTSSPSSRQILFDEVSVIDGDEGAKDGDRLIPSEER